MKRLVFFISFVLILAGCKKEESYPTDNTYHFETDSQYSFYSQGGFRNFAESEEGYYFTLNISGLGYIFYMDKSTMKPVALCGKPNCLHYRETEEEKISLCNAQLSGLGFLPPLFYSDGHLYTFQISEDPSKYNFVEIQKDGSSRKTLLTIEKENADSSCFAVHRGKLYHLLATYNENMESIFKVLCYSLQKPQKNPECIFQLEGNDIFAMMDLKLYGNYLYFGIYEKGKRQYYAVNLITKQGRHIFEFDEEKTGIYNLAVLDSRIVTNRYYEDQYYYEDLSSDRLKAKMYIADLDGSHVEVLNEVINEPYSADANYLYQWTKWSAGKLLAETPSIWIYDKNGTLLVEYDPLKEVPDYRDIYVSPGEYVFLYCTNRICYFSKSEIPSGTITPKVLIDLTDLVQN